MILIMCVQLRVNEKYHRYRARKEKAKKEDVTAVSAQCNESSAYLI